jgi:hypothetical protein
MAFTLLVSLIAMGLLYATLCKFELTAKYTRIQLRAARRLLEEGSPGGASSAPRRTRSAVPSVYPASPQGRMAGGQAS